MEYTTILREVIKEVKESPKVEISLFDWFNLNYDPFPTRTLNALEIKNFFVDRDVEIKSLLKIILSSYEKTGGKIALVAPDGYGKTTLINFLFHLLKQYKSEIKRNLSSNIEGGIWTFEELMRKEQIEEDEVYHGLDRFIDGLSHNTTFWVFDDCNDPQGVKTWISKAEKRREEIILILIFSTGNWRKMKKEFQEFVNTFRTIIYIKKMTRNSIIELIEKRLENHSIFETEITNEIAERSDGVPWFAVRMARECMIMGKQMMKRKIDRSVLEKALDKTYDMRYASNLVYRLSTRQKEVMLRLLDYEDGTTAEEIGDYLDITRPTAVYHLRELYNKDLLETKRKGRSLQYSIREPFKIAYESLLDNDEG